MGALFGWFGVRLAGFKVRPTLACGQIVLDSLHKFFLRHGRSGNQTLPRHITLPRDNPPPISCAEVPPCKPEDTVRMLLRLKGPDPSSQAFGFTLGFCGSLFWFVVGPASHFPFCLFSCHLLRVTPPVLGSVRSKGNLYQITLLRSIHSSNNDKGCHGVKQERSRFYALCFSTLFVALLTGCPNLEQCGPVDLHTLDAQCPWRCP